jgi:hypothetical protein
VEVVLNKSLLLGGKARQLLQLLKTWSLSENFFSYIVATKLITGGKP